MVAALAQNGHLEDRGGSQLRAQGGSQLRAHFQPARREFVDWPRRGSGRTAEGPVEHLAIENQGALRA